MDQDQDPDPNTQDPNTLKTLLAALAAFKSQNPTVRRLGRVQILKAIRQILRKRRGAG